ncbi:hypothetical protein Tco_0075334, partial [Tanacetum coccineum]
ICPRIPGQEFSDPPFEEETLSFVRHLGHTREFKYLTNITVDHLHQPWRALASIINKCLSGKVSGLGLSDREQRCKEVRQDVLPKIYQGNHQPLSEKEPFHFNEEPAATPTRKSPWMKRAAKITFAGSKKKTKAKADTGKGLKVLSEVALFKEAQLKEKSDTESWGDSNKDNDDKEEALDKAGNDDDDDDDDDDGDDDDGDDDDGANDDDDNNDDDDDKDN